MGRNHSPQGQSELGAARYVSGMLRKAGFWMRWPLVLGIMAHSLAKGFALEVHPYALSQYMYSYEQGLLVRGLPGQVTKLACRERFECIERAVDVTSAIVVVGFVFALVLVVRAQWRSERAMWLLALVGSGPLLVSIGATRGYHDSLTLALGLLAYYCYRRRRTLLSLILFGVALLVHEIVAIYVLPLFALPLLTPQRPKRWFKHVAVVALMVAGTLLLVRKGAADDRQQRALVAKLERSAPELSHGWRGYGNFGLIASEGSNSSRLHFARLKSLSRPDLRAYLLPIVVLVVLAAVVLLRRVVTRPQRRPQSLASPVRRFNRNRAVYEALLYLSLMVLPLMVYVVAWDFVRLACLASVTGVVVCAEVFRRFAAPTTPAWVGCLIAICGLIQLAEPYPKVVKRYARNHTALAALRHRFAENRTR
jgi:4-amino-4-deoxy-L-arabinose transferase-like glycosyltransferase